MSRSPRAAVLQKAGVGTLIAHRRPWFSRIFFGDVVEVAFRPDFQGASWYLVKYPADPLVLADQADAFAAMAYLRKCDPSLTPTDLHLR